MRINLVGRSTMGKTTLGVDIIREILIKQVNRVFVVCPTFWQQPAFQPLHEIKNCFGVHNVFTKVSDSVFEKIFRILDKSKHIKTLLIIDDAAAEAATNKGNKGSFSRLCLASPHLNLSIVGCFQRAAQCTVSLRDNTEVMIMFKGSRSGDIKLLIDEYNPYPCDRTFPNKLRDALNRCWETDRFVFVYREAFTGNIHYYVGTDTKIDWNHGASRSSMESKI